MWETRRRDGTPVLARSVLWGPMAYAIMGGLLTATVRTLLFVPALYAACFRVKRPSAGQV